MDRRITSSDLIGLNPIVCMAFRVSYPNGLTMQELAESEYGWLRSIYKYCRKKEGLT